MNTDNGNEPAFSGQTLEGFHKGLSKREMLSAMFMQAFVGKPDALIGMSKVGEEQGIATMAIHYADALLKQLKASEAEPVSQDDLWDEIKDIAQDNITWGTTNVDKGFIDHCADKFTITKK